MTAIRSKMESAVCALLSLSLILGGCAAQTGPAEEQGTRHSIEPVAIDHIVVSQTARATQVIIQADAPLTFSYFKKSDPPTVVLIFAATTTSKMSAPPLVESELVQRVLANDGSGGRTAKVEFQLTVDAAFRASQEGNQVKLIFDDPQAAGPATQAQVDVDATQPRAAADQTSAAVGTQPQKEPPRKAGLPKRAAWVNKIDFIGQLEKGSTLVLGTTHAVNYKIHKPAPRRIEIELVNTRIPSHRQRAMITTQPASPVDRVVPYQVEDTENETRVAIEMRQAVPYSIEQLGSILLVRFEASSMLPKPMEQALAEGEGAGKPGPATRKDQSLSEDEEPAFHEKVLLEDEMQIRDMLAPQRKKYTGGKVALDFYDTDIKNVFRILREVSGKNFAIDKDVAGKVTMTLEKPVPWDQVLDLALRMNQLGMVHEGDIVRIATMETLKREDDLRRSKMEALRKAREEQKALEPLVTKYLPVSYSNAESEIRPHIEKILTAGRGSVTVDTKNNQIIVTDTASKVKQAEIVVRRIDKVTAQVIIEAKVVEVSKDFSKELGIDWTSSYGPGVIGGLNWNTSTDLAMNFPSAGTSSMGLSFSRLSGVPFVLNARLNALETTGEGRILSSPKILTLDNKKAKIKQGLEFAYLERDSSGGSSVAFKSIDLLLEVTPHVTPDDRISLIIFITKNDVAGFTAGVPNVATNEAETELLVNDGDTVVIGGIVKRTHNKGKTAFPVLSKIPLLGWAFQSTMDATSDDEMLIFMTPRIVQLEQRVTE